MVLTNGLLENNPKKRNKEIKNCNSCLFQAAGLLQFPCNQCNQNYINQWKIRQGAIMTTNYTKKSMKDIITPQIFKYKESHMEKRKMTQQEFEQFLKDLGFNDTMVQQLLPIAQQEGYIEKTEIEQAEELLLRIWTNINCKGSYILGSYDYCVIEVAFKELKRMKE